MKTLTAAVNLKALGTVRSTVKSKIMTKEEAISGACGIGIPYAPRMPHMPQEILSGASGINGATKGPRGHEPGRMKRLTNGSWGYKRFEG